jgi:hypothetical protein
MGANISAGSGERAWREFPYLNWQFSRPGWLQAVFRFLTTTSCGFRLPAMFLLEIGLVA